MLETLKSKGVIKPHFEKNVKPRVPKIQSPSSQEDWSQEWEQCPFHVEELPFDEEQFQRDLMDDVNHGCFDKLAVPLIEIPDDPPREVYEDDWGQGLNDTNDSDFSDSQRTLCLNDFHDDDDNDEGHEVSQPVMLGQGGSAGSVKFRRSNACLF